MYIISEIHTVTINIDLYYSIVHVRRTNNNNTFNTLSHENIVVKMISSSSHTNVLYIQKQIQYTHPSIGSRFASIRS